MTAAADGVITRQGMREKYGVSATVVVGWISRPGFPDLLGTVPPPAPGRGRPLEQYDEAAVDAWVQVHEKQVWLTTHEGPEAAREAARRRLPPGDPQDLLDLDDFAVILGEFNRGEAVGRRAMRSYRSRGQIPAADRRPGDGLTPEVYEEMWYRSTVDEHVLNQAGTGMRGVPRERKKKSTEPTE